ncbi:MAG: hypothetical protein LH679_03625, partial [Cyanobacteria bacterium CAN_BIN43]|nr:hypothetical protein [Cyanobacteria bacterium CAN_BIN43]
FKLFTQYRRSLKQVNLITNKGTMPLTAPPVRQNRNLLALLMLGARTSATLANIFCLGTLAISLGNQLL